MLGGVARRLKRGVDNEMNPGEVFSRVQDHVIAAARAHVERLVLEAFIDKIRRAARRGPQGRAQPACDLHALSTIEADRAWLMEHGRLTIQRSKAISREIKSLCRKMRPLAEDLVDAFGVPRGDAAGPRPGRRVTCSLPRVGRAFGGWHEDPLWAPVYDWTVEHPQVGGVLWKAGLGSELSRLYGAAAEIGRQPAVPGSSTYPAVEGWRCAGSRWARAWGTSRRTSQHDARAHPRGRRRPGCSDQVDTLLADVGDCRSRTTPSTWSSRSPGCTASRTRRAPWSRWCACWPRRGAQRERDAQRHRRAVRSAPAGRPGRGTARAGLHQGGADPLAG